MTWLFSRSVMRILPKGFHSGVPLMSGSASLFYLCAFVLTLNHCASRGRSRVDSGKFGTDHMFDRRILAESADGSAVRQVVPVFRSAWPLVKVDRGGVAMTENGAASFCLPPSAVIRASSIASSIAVCTLVGARLISSVRVKLPNSGPCWKSKRCSPGFQIAAPVRPVDLPCSGGI